MILLLGATSYTGQAFAKALRRRKYAFIPLSRSALDYGKFELLLDYVRRIKPEFVINAAEQSDDGGMGETGFARWEMLHQNALLPQTIASVCAVTNTPWGHVSSGSIYRGAKIRDNGAFRIEPDLSQASVRELFDSEPQKFVGFSEDDEPNFSFRCSPCTFFSGTNALAEEAIRHQGQNYVWRMRLHFNEQDEPANFLSRIRGSERVPDSINSLSHTDDCVGACLELWERKASFGVYNMVNPGGVTNREIAQSIQRILKPARGLKLLVYGGESGTDTQTAAPGCLLDSSKLLLNGIRLRGVREAVETSLHKWQPQGSQGVRTFG